MAELATVDRFARDVRVKIQTGIQSGGGVRSAVCEFSTASRRRLLFSAFNALTEWRAFVTLTYPGEFSNDGERVKENLNAFLSAARAWTKRECGAALEYLWALEFQKRGAPHFHILTSAFVPKEWLSREWFNVVDSGDEKHLRAGTSVECVASREQGAFYMTKEYTAKKFQKDVPVEYRNVGRFWGTSRGLVRPIETREVELSENETGIILRTLRKFAERNLPARRVRPVYGERTNADTGEIETVQRARAVCRKPVVRNFRGDARTRAFVGFTCFNGSRIAARLLENYEVQNG